MTLNRKPIRTAGELVALLLAVPADTPVLMSAEFVDRTDEVDSVTARINRVSIEPLVSTPTDCGPTRRLYLRG